jgi:NhaP-type Na+/H+ or K+/H+ antiporter
MRNSGVKRSFPTRLWLSTVSAILAIVAVGIVLNRVEGGAASPIAWRLAAAVVVTAAVAVAKIVAGTRAAAVTGVVGTAIAVVLLLQLA